MVAAAFFEQRQLEIVSNYYDSPTSDGQPSYKNPAWKKQTKGMQS
jgi:hypothetical protein